MFDVLSTEGVLSVPAAPAEPEQAGARPQLGQVLLDRGLLTEDQLEVGLAQHRWSGRPLGEVLIALGFVSEATIAQALATQHGGLIKTECGFAMGFGPRADAAPDGPPVSPPAAAVGTSWTSMPEVTAEPPAEPEPVATALPQLEVVAAPTPVEAFEERAKAAAAEARVLELEEELRNASRRADAAEARVASLEADSGSASVRHEALELELAGARQAEADARAAGERQARELAEATQTLQAAFARLQYLEALVQQPQSAHPAPAAAQKRSPYAWQD